jgi:DNA-binding winged helix-turn-helix (wHTH) protein
MSRRRADSAGRAADHKSPQYRKRVPLAAKPFKNGSPLPRIPMIAQFGRPHAQGGNIMQPLYDTPKLQQKAGDYDGSAIVPDRESVAATGGAFEFGRFRVLRRQRRLLADGVPVELGTRAFDILMVLLEADGALITKEELLSRVWPGIFVEQDNLKLHISTLRKALGEDRDFIRTDFGRGYRFVAAVHSTTVAPEYVPVLGVTRSHNGWNAASPPDLSVIASKLTCLEVRLAEALNLLTTYRRSSRLQRCRYTRGHSSRRRSRRRLIGSVSGGAALREKSLDLTC